MGSIYSFNLLYIVSILLLLHSYYKPFMADTAKQILERLSHLPSPINVNDHVNTEIPFESTKTRITEKLKLNNFSMNMIKHVNGFSKNNYTCSYYQEEGLLIFHVNTCLTALSYIIIPC